ncbi:TVP38/TMEM64 family protein [Clostridium perfringens]|uniref:TVP38/TMEM64 family protein n=1 Tax=Clostridium perfringens TaxID=1502 RepID=UPI00066850A6|nr:TVP38/TMEM64 family protein [Clostridium perfringens]MBI6050508.1 TVP38/TMEM64 family protein [Clostridium perfringens]MBX9100199.1 TVP38/TMEM64 family protein [Clostridium perfringens]MDB2039289.1 TVP38/TMEM64 family protein [Clostridium perfringens]MDB2048151.1 TVP38/TMEM64 family protein [Clostridium perfringens]MDK0639058.1 TVP38/TMEM64 family protein [Clostridium perfringens]
MKKIVKPWVATLIILIVAFLVYFFVPTANSKINQMIFYLSSMNLDMIKEYILSFGIWSPITSFLLMVLQSVIAPIPAFLITLSNAAIFGWVKGAILSWSSAMAGAALCFYIARGLGRDAVEKLTSKFALKDIDGFFEKYGKHTILIARLLPFISFDLVSYAAGLTSMNFWSFFIATGIGQLPATIVYSYVGGMLTGGAQLLMSGLLILFALSIAIYVGKKVWNEKRGKNDK